jgi:minor extracellular serine protease Vpr
MKNKYTVGLIAASLIGSVQVGATPIDTSSIQLLNISPEISSVTHNKITKALHAQQQDNYYIVRLQAQSLAKAGYPTAAAAVPGNSSLNVAAQTHINALAQERAVFAARLSVSVPTAQVDRHYDTVMNAVVVRSKKNIYSQLAAMDGVSKVFTSKIRHANMDTSVSLINATQVWEQLGGKENAGAGVKVAVIDTGIRPEHPMFTDEGFTAPAWVPADDYCSLAPDFCNNKLITARAATPTSDIDWHPDEHMTPLGFRTHGTHVAGTAVGNHVTTDYLGNDVELSGVAPGAYLMAYKGLYGTADGNGSGSDIMLMQTLDWAIEDGADVINNSWGGGAGSDPADSPYAEAFETAEANGIVVVGSAGNSGPGASTIGCPSCVESGISVASSVHGRFFTNTLDFGTVQGAMAVQSTATNLTEDITGSLVSALSVDEANFEGCTAFPADSFSGKIALVSRGACSFVDKANNAAAAGAIAIIVYNSVDGLPIVQFADGITIPSVMVSNVDGAAMLAQLEAGVTEVTIGADTQKIIIDDTVDAMSDFSSRGPNGNRNTLKPDITAPGSNILSAVSPEEHDGASYGQLSGTSMASPHVAGAAAILKQTYPNWSATDIKTALITTSKNTGLRKEDYVTPVDPFDIGAGRLDLHAANMAGVTFDKPSMAMNPCIVNCDFDRTMLNKTDAEVTWNASISFVDESITGAVWPSSLTLAAMSDEADSQDDRGHFKVSVDTGSLEENAWVFGTVTWTDASGTYPDAHMSIAVAADTTTMTSFSSGSGEIGGQMEMSTTLLNTNDMFNEQVRIDIKPPMGTTIVVDSEAAELNGAVETLLDNDDIGNRISWTGTLAAASFLAAQAESQVGVSISDFGANVLDCGEACDDVSIDIDLSGNELSFDYNGTRYSSLSISSNGYIIVGTGNAATAANQQLPSNSEPNNVLAPFWTDFDLSKNNDNGTGGGDIYTGIFNFGTVPYLGVEWKDAQLFGDTSGKKYTVAAWISLGETQDIFFDYVEVDETLPEGLTIGAEDATGSKGDSYYFNGEGGPVTSAMAVKLTTAPESSVKLTYKLDVTGPLALGMADSAELAEDSGSVSIAPLANDMTAKDAKIDITISHGGMAIKTPSNINLMAEGELDATTVAVVEQPANGTATTNEDGTLSYTPNADYNGTDTFTYDVADAAGVRIAPTTVSVVVTPVDEPLPVVVPPPAVVKTSSGGTTGLFALLLLPLAMLRRRK